jgi:hypothetical protein
MLKNHTQIHMALRDARFVALSTTKAMRITNRDEGLLLAHRLHKSNNLHVTRFAVMFCTLKTLQSLHWMNAGSGRIQIVRFLRTKYVNIEALDCWAASRDGHLDVVKLLAAAYFFPNSATSHFNCACFVRTNLSVVWFLAHMPPTNVFFNGAVALWHARIYSSIAVVRFLRTVCVM